jgi:hypothetical protein
MQPLLPPRPALKQIVSEAARALAHLDAGRLEELALSCQALNRELTPDSNRDGRPSLPISQAERLSLAAEARAAQLDMEIFARVLEATRANVQVIERLRELRLGRLEYTAWRDPRWPSMGDGQGENRHGND